MGECVSLSRILFLVPSIIFSSVGSVTCVNLLYFLCQLLFCFVSVTFFIVFRYYVLVQLLLWFVSVTFLPPVNYFDCLLVCGFFLSCAHFFDFMYVTSLQSHLIHFFSVNFMPRISFLFVLVNYIVCQFFLPVSVTCETLSIYFYP